MAVRDVTKENQAMREELEMLRKKHDSVNHPVHYNSSKAVCRNCDQKIECIDISRHFDFAIGNCIKYLWRAGLKNKTLELEDLKKAAWYLNDKISQLQHAESSRENSDAGLENDPQAQDRNGILPVSDTPTGLVGY